jgi:DNA end-binding protein Ku
MSAYDGRAKGWRKAENLDKLLFERRAEASRSGDMRRKDLPMAPRPFWNGYLKLSLVTCPVAMTAATSEEDKVRFHVLNRRTGNRILSQSVDAETGRPVGEDDEVKGYARGEDDYILLEDDELESIALESARTIDIETFVPLESIDPIWFDTPYYVTPDDPVGEEAYCVIRDAMRSVAMAGVSRLVLHRREQAVILKAREKGIVLWTLRFGDEVHDPGDYFASIGDVKPDPELMRLIGGLIKSRKKAWSPEMVADPVQARLLDIIAAKKKGTKKAKAKPSAESEPPSNVINIMDALRRSVAAAKKPKGRS